MLVQRLSANSTPLRLIANARLLLIGLFTTVVGLLWLGGAFNGAFGGESDEPTHYVTAVMIRDYLAAGLPGDPLPFAKDFYLHYPNVGFGLWPPLFHMFSGVWMLLIGTDRISVMLMLASATTAWGMLFYATARQVAGPATAALSALWLVTLPATQAATASVMLDVGVAIATVGAMAAYARYLQSERIKDSCIFGLWAAAAVLTKYNALALALVPPISVLLTGRYSLLRTKSFWVPAAIVLVSVCPWYIAMRHFVEYAADPGGAWPPLGQMIAANLGSIALLAGPVLFVLAAFGAVLTVFASRLRQTRPALYTVSIATVLSVWLFHSLVYPIHAPRYLLMAAPALLLLASVPLRQLVDRYHLNRGILAFAGVVYIAFTFTVPQKRTLSWAEAADAVLAYGLPRGGAVLVSADGAGEGMLVAEIAMRDVRPDHFVLRANKVLASQTLMGAHYKQRYSTHEELMRALDSVPVSMLVLQSCAAEQCSGHERLLADLVMTRPERWRLLSMTAARPSEPAIRIYRVIGNEGKPARKVSIDMKHTLGGTLEQP